MLSFRRIDATHGEAHVAELAGPNGTKYEFRVYKLPYERKWTVTLSDPARDVVVQRRFFAPTTTQAAKTAVDLVVAELRERAAVANAVLPQLTNETA